MKKKKDTYENKTVSQKMALASIELCGNCEAIIDGCEGVIEYSSERIKLNLGKNEVEFKGDHLTLGNFTLGQTIIEGQIVSIEFST